MANLVDPNDLMFKKFQPKTQNRFILTVDGVPSWMIKKAARPSLKFATITLDHINTKRKIQGSFFPTFRSVIERDILDVNCAHFIFNST